MTYQKHIINRQLLEVRIPRNADNYTLQETISRIYREDIVPLIDAYLNAYSSPDEIDRIERLELDLGRLDPQNLRETFIEQFAQQLREQLPVVLAENETISIQQPELPVEKAESPGMSIANGQTFVFGKQEEANDGLPFAAGQTFVFGEQPDDQQSNEVQENHEKEVAGSAFSNAEKPEQSSRNAEVPRRTTRSKTESDFELVGFYLRYGVFPWWAKEQSFGQFKASVSALLETAAQPLRNLLLKTIEYPNELKRLVFSSDEQLLQQIIRTYAPDRQPDLQKLQTEWLKSVRTKQQDSTTLKLMWWQEIVPLVLNNGNRYPDAILTAVLAVEDEKESEKYVKMMRLLTKIADEFNLTDVKPAIQKAENEFNRIVNQEGESEIPKSVNEVLNDLRLKTAKSSFSDSLNIKSFAQARSYEPFSESDSIHVNNAGLVLIAQFFRPFFEKLGLMNEGEWVNESSQEKACLMLHFLVAGDAVAPFEGILPLAKLLCGIPFDHPVNLRHKITKKDKKLGEELIEAVIGYIPGLKNTSIDGFRGSFLVREGIVSTRDGNWLLRVERKPYDILLEQVPWNYKLIRLSWMKHFVNVEW